MTTDRQNQLRAPTSESHACCAAGTICNERWQDRDSRGFGIVARNVRIVQETEKIFEADLNRKAYSAGLNTFVVSPSNARKQLTAFLSKARRQLWIYNPKISDRDIMKLLEDRAKAGVEIRVIGAMEARSANIAVSPLTVMRLHTRTIIRDAGQAFVGSQSLRPAKLDLRREIGIVIRDPKAVKELVSVFEKDWQETGYDEAGDALMADAGVADAATLAATKALVKEMPPLPVRLLAGRAKMRWSTEN